MKATTKLWIGLICLVALTSLGLFFPEYFKAGAAWGEWGIEEIGRNAGYIPKGLEKLYSLWQAPLEGYSFIGWQEDGIVARGFSYSISALIGFVFIVLIMFLIGKALTKRQ